MVSLGILYNVDEYIEHNEIKKWRLFKIRDSKKRKKKKVRDSNPGFDHILACRLRYAIPGRETTSPGPGVVR